MASNYVYNFGAGPAKIPQPVLAKVQAEMLNYGDTGMSVMELSHRTPAFEAILAHTKARLTELLNVPDTHTILLMQGGATTQFSSIFYNLVAAKVKANEGSTEPINVDYIVTGDWSHKAAQEADRLSQGAGVPVKVHRVVNTGPSYTSLPPSSTWTFSDPKNTAYVYYCDNETVRGVEFSDIPEVPSGVPLVADISSNFLSRPVDVSKFALLYGGAQKNLGPAGVTIVIVRKDLLTDISVKPVRPLILDYATMAKNNSMYNTPPTFAIYVVGHVLDWLVEMGGLKAIQTLNERKARKLYDTISQSKLFYCPVDDECKSRMNVIFKLPTPELEKLFLAGAEERQMVQLQGHRSVGGLRASIYNAMPEEDVDVLIDFMDYFECYHGEST